MNAFVPIPLVPLRTAPAETSEMCSQLLYGEQVEVLDTQPRWLHVRCLTDGYTGWCDRKMLQTLTPGMEDAFRQAQWRTVRTALCACLTRDGHRMWLPGGSRISSLAHVCRTITRRAERRIVELSNTAPVNEQVLIYINRLSDYFFVLARFNNIHNQFEENFWDKDCR